MHVCREHLVVEACLAFDLPDDRANIAVLAARSGDDEDFAGAQFRSSHLRSRFASMSLAARLPYSFGISFDGIPVPGRFVQIMSSVIVSPARMGRVDTTERNAQVRISFSRS